MIKTSSFFLNLSFKRNEIASITVNEEKRVIAVVFKDGEKQIIKCAKTDDFDVNVGVSLAIANHLYGSKTHLHKEIAKKAKFVAPKAAKKPENNSQIEVPCKKRLTLKEKRIAIGLTQTEFAKRAGLTLAAYNQIENGKRKPRKYSVAKINKLLKEYN